MCLGTEIGGGKGKGLDLGKCKQDTRGRSIMTMEEMVRGDCPSCRFGLICPYSYCAMDNVVIDIDAINIVIIITVHHCV